MNLIKLTTPQGVLYLRPEKVIAFAETKALGSPGYSVRTYLWMEQHADYFNIMEDIATVRNLLSGSSTNTHDCL